MTAVIIWSTVLLNKNLVVCTYPLYSVHSPQGHLLRSNPVSSPPLGHYGGFYSLTRTGSTDGACSFYLGQLSCYHVNIDRGLCANSGECCGFHSIGFCSYFDFYIYSITLFILLNKHVFSLNSCVVSPTLSSLESGSDRGEFKTVEANLWLLDFT